TAEQCTLRGSPGPGRRFPSPVGSEASLAAGPICIQRKSSGRNHKWLRTGRELVEFRCPHCFHGSERGGICSLLSPRRREKADESAAAGFRLCHLSAPVVEPQHHGADFWGHLDGRRDSLWCVEDTRLPRQSG